MQYSKALATELSKEAIRLYYVNTEGVVQERVIQAGQIGILGTWWDCVECGAACYACVIASGKFKAEKLTIEEAQKEVNFTIVKPEYTAGYELRGC
jgi:hypothetical protein